MIQNALERGVNESQEPKSTHAFVRSLGVPELPACISPFDPGYDVQTVISHLEQSHHLISRLKLSMACWMIADESATRAKIAAAKRLGVPMTTGGGPFEISEDKGKLEDFFELVASLGIDRVEAGEGFTRLKRSPREYTRLAERYGLTVQMELGDKHGGAFTPAIVAELIDNGYQWLDAGARAIVVEARESAQQVGLFDDSGKLNFEAAEAFAAAFGMDKTIFEAPNKRSQFDFLRHFGNHVHLSNVRLEEVLRVEIYRRGLHSDAYAHALASRPVADATP
ncbi:MAG: phosphosulfolactate synthase [Candidatus Dormibacteraceae bacterium]